MGVRIEGGRVVLGGRIRFMWGGFRMLVILGVDFRSIFGRIFCKEFVMKRKLGCT